MLQRIQSVYLFFAFTALALLSAFPVITLQTKTPETGLAGSIPIKEIKIYAFSEATRDADSAKNPNPKEWHLLNFLVYLMAIILCITTFFLFANRSWQLRLCWSSIGLILALSVFIYNNIQAVLNSSATKSLGIGAYSLSASILLLLLARKQIQKDENLVRSVDRLR